ncbi:MAG: acyl-CoA/acyl-ACP dehydrogenase [Candidatus Lokiarchaeota archaeon]|nr:acyl-CoA/acyl-ACP dehydrogenase [Candidatus Lokiarchaeota archaeon]
MSNKKGKVQCIADEILEKLSLNTRNKFLNYNLMSFLKPKHFNFLKQAQKFLENFEKTNQITHNEDFYAWIPEIGRNGYISRLHKFEDIGLNYEPHGMTAEFMRILAMDFFDPQLTMATGATAISVNPILLHNEDVDIRLRAVKELVTGEKIGCICITEPERGSDAVHMQTTCDEQEDGSFLVNGEKIYQTNGSKADWAVVYAVTEKNNGNTMAQFLVDTSWDGWAAERVNIPWTPRMHVSKETFTNLKVPFDCILGKPGDGRSHLFEGLNLERLTIVCLNTAEAWNAITHAVIYANMRKQFNKEILKYQGVGFPLADLWAQTMNMTLSTLNVCRMIDEKMEKFGTLPKDFNLALGTTASQLKFLSAKLCERVVYESSNLMGGAGVCDNTLMHDLLGITRLQEIGGGTRQVQSHIMSSALRQLFRLL